MLNIVKKCVEHWEKFENFTFSKIILKIYEKRFQRFFEVFLAIFENFRKHLKNYFHDFSKICLENFDFHKF